MFRKLSLKALASGAVAVSGVLAGIQTAEAGPVKVRFTPEYGAPFNTATNGVPGRNLEWFGEAIIDDGSCTAFGPDPISNLSSTCAGQFSFISATVFFANASTPTVAKQTIHFEGGQVLSVQRNSPNPPDWREVVSTPFNTEVGEIDETLYDPDGAGSQPGTPAYFSLIFIGGYAQLYWFQNDPGDFLRDPLRFPYLQGLNALYYRDCFKAGPGDNKVGFGTRLFPHNQCGLSSNLEGNGNGARLFGFEDADAIPEPGTLALVFAAGLGAMGLKSRRRGRTT